MKQFEISDKFLSFLAVVCIFTGIGFLIIAFITGFYAGDIGSIVFFLDICAPSILLGTVLLGIGLGIVDIT